jgi:hypothetical protein
MAVHDLLSLSARTVEALTDPRYGCKCGPTQQPEKYPTQQPEK